MTTLLIGLLIPLASGGDTPWILLLGPAGAVAVYWGLFQFYRNTGRSHSFERETLIESKPITGTDQKVDEVRGTQRTSIDGNNVHNHRQRVRRW
ncbi:MAG: hypothetical protein CVT65_08075 [Actinobacteria bacterium HGW-Actinobacteria-5]|jgi:hypothetical protein|nr:MAG: hypothetical protein CVT65_08075 [Actinobacteria bacterium HGW-Actinobacteria-5]